MANGNSSSLELYLQQLIEKHSQQIQVGLRGAPPIGPGRVEKVDMTTPGFGDRAPLYRLVVEAMIPTPSPIAGAPPTMTPVFLPMVFSADDLVWLNEGPIGADGQPIVIMNQPAQPGPGRGQRGGLQIG